MDFVNFFVNLHGLGAALEENAAELVLAGAEAEAEAIGRGKDQGDTTTGADSGLEGAAMDEADEPRGGGGDSGHAG